MQILWLTILKSKEYDRLQDNYQRKVELDKILWYDSKAFTRIDSDVLKEIYKEFQSTKNAIILKNYQSHKREDIMYRNGAVDSINIILKKIMDTLKKQAI